MSNDKDTPFITSESPSMRRAQHEYQHPSPATDPEVIAALSRIVEREHATAAAYRVGLARVAPAGRLSGTGEVHESRAAALSALIDRLGGVAPRSDEADPRAVPVSAAEIEYLHTPEAITSALARDDAAVAEAYEDALDGLLDDDVQQELQAIRAMTAPFGNHA